MFEQQPSSCRRSPASEQRLKLILQHAEQVPRHPPLTHTRTFQGWESQWQGWYQSASGPHAAAAAPALKSTGEHLQHGSVRTRV